MCCFNGKELILKNQIAYRSFYMDEDTGILRPTNYDYDYSTGVKFSTDIPRNDNEYGFYAYQDKSLMYDMEGSIGATVKLSGHSVAALESENDGWRSEEMEIVEFFVRRSYFDATEDHAYVNETHWGNTFDAQNIPFLQLENDYILTVDESKEINRLIKNLNKTLVSEQKKIQKLIDKANKRYNGQPVKNIVSLLRNRYHRKVTIID